MCVQVEAGSGGQPVEVTRIRLEDQGGAELVMGPDGAHISADCPVLRHVMTACLTAHMATL